MPLLKLVFDVLTLLLITFIIITDYKCCVNNNFMEVLRMMNQDIRRTAAGAGVKLWQIAEALGIADCSLSRKLRKELPQEEKEKIFSIIKRLSQEVV